MILVLMDYHFSGECAPNHFLGKQENRTMYLNIFSQLVFLEIPILLSPIYIQKKKKRNSTQ